MGPELEARISEAQVRGIGRGVPGGGGEPSPRTCDQKPRKLEGDAVMPLCPGGECHSQPGTVSHMLVQKNHLASMPENFPPLALPFFYNNPRI